MKKFMALLLSAAMILSCCAFASAEQVVPGKGMEEVDYQLLLDAQEEGELTVYGSCEEDYLAAACKHFEELYGIKVYYQRLSTGQVQSKITEENGNPSGDVWFGGTNDPYNECAKEGLLMEYEATNAKHLIGAQYRDEEGYWYGIYKGILGIMVNTAELELKGLTAPQSWADLLKPEYAGLVWTSNPSTAGTAKLVINTMVQMMGHDKAMEYFVELDKNVQQYTKSGSGPSKKVGVGECVIGIGFLHDGVYQILQGYKSIGLVIPAEGTSYEIGSTAIFEGCQHEAAAKLWIEYALSPECVELADDNGSYQFLVLDNAEQPAAIAPFGLDPDNVIDYDFQDAKENTTKYTNDFIEALGGSHDDRFKTE